MNMQQKLALEEAVEWIYSTYKPIGIIACGSIICGNGNANSDFDIQVIHTAPYRQRVQKFFHEVPFEIFINHPDHILGYFESEFKANRPSTAHMLAAGDVVMSADNTIINHLIAEAKNYVNKSPVLSTAQLELRKHSLVTILEDAADVIETDSATAQLLLNRIAEQIIEFVFAVHQRPLPRIKERIKVLHDVDAETATSITTFYASNDIQEQYKLIHDVVLKLTGYTSFFEWESEKD